MWLSKRDTTILNSLIKLYTAEKRPVSSRNLSSILPFSESLIRKELHKLENWGFVKKSSVSSGRTPSDRGLKLYLRNLIPFIETDTKNDSIKWQISDQNFNELSMKSAGHLTSWTSNIGFIYLNSIFELPFKMIRLIKTGNSKVMVVVDSVNGWIFSKMFQTDKNYSGNELKKWENILNEEFRGKSLKNTFKIIRNRLFRYKEKYITFYKGLYFLLGSKDLSTSDIIYKGVLEMIDSDIFNPEAVKKILKTLQMKEQFASFLKDLLNDNSESPVAAFGNDSGISELEDFILVVSNFDVLRSPLGKIGVIGPKSMEYSKSFYEVNKLSNYFSSVLSENTAEV